MSYFQELISEASTDSRPSYEQMYNSLIYYIAVDILLLELFTHA
jgi:hypothetical protein